MSQEALSPDLVPTPLTRQDYIAWGVAGAVLLLLLPLDLLPALLGGLLVYELVNVLVPWLKLPSLGRDGPRLVAVAIIATVTIALMVLAGAGIASYLRSGESVPALLERMAQIVEDSRAMLPAWLLSSLPEDAEEARLAVVAWLRANAGVLRGVGTEAGRVIALVLIGMIIGALLSLEKAVKRSRQRVLARVVAEHATRFADSFRRVVFAQFWISLINTTLTALYLGVVLPMFGVDLPLKKTLIAVTFVAGFLPILGNLISNTVIFVVSLSHSLLVALAALAYLVVIHKLEYFLNARIIGSHIRAKVWELLIAMLVMEAAFGIPGLIAAPVYYAYIKDELREKGLV